MSRIAVVLFNLGGPDGPSSVKPFLYNLFSDPAIVGAPGFIRKPLAAFISATREKSAIANYARMGGGSPIVVETLDQANALEDCLRARRASDEVKVFIAMRYWAPRARDVAQAVRAFSPDEVVLVPLYPQFSTTTTGSSLTAWRAAYRGVGVSRAICCWYAEPGFITAHVQRILETWRAAGTPKVRLLFSAHGLPERTIAAGDPYQWQIEQTCAAIVAGLDGDWDWKICYQSRVGPLKWLGPSTPDALREAAREGLDVLIDPVAFVSEHIETLVEKRDARRDGFARVMAKAFKAKLGDKADDVAKVLAKYGIPRDLAKRALATAERQGRFTIFSLVDALTRHAADIENAGDRLAADEKAGALLALVDDEPMNRPRALLAAAV